MNLRRLVAFERLARWLAPGADPLASPAGIERRERSIPAQAGRPALQTFVYAPPAEPLGSVLIAHGLNPWGPLDPRADRFARILAHAGLQVTAPALPDYLALRCDPNVAIDFARAFDALLADPSGPSCAPAVLSISFGSFPALRLLADPSRSAQLGRAILFGGYADPVATLRFCLGDGAEGSPPPDPLNMTAVAINLVGALGRPEAECSHVSAAWLELARATWGKPELKAPAAHAPIAHALASKLSPAERELFLRGAGLLPDSTAFWQRTLRASEGQLASIDPRPELLHMAKLAAPVHLMHGRDDDVIPFREIDALAAALERHARVSCYVTGLYGHTQTGGATHRIPALAREAITFARMLAVVASIGA